MVLAKGSRRAGMNRRGLIGFCNKEIRTYADRHTEVSTSEVTQVAN